MVFPKNLICRWMAIVAVASPDGVGSTGLASNSNRLQRRDFGRLWHSIRGDARCLDRDRAPLAARHPAACAAKPDALTQGPQGPGLRVDRRQLHHAVTDRTRSIEIDGRDFVVGHLAPPRVPLMEPLPYGTTGAEFQEIVALGNRGLPVIVPKLLGLYTLSPARRQGVGFG
jgi:hypothetical protein